MTQRACAFLLISFLLVPLDVLAQGEVYLVLGSDTAIWDGMDVAQYHCTYNLALFTDPLQNATRVMNPGFRMGLTDSYGTPVKLTWWMMAGNIFRQATNTNVPHPNTMTLHLMKEYNGNAIRQWDDELTLHYHTFVWTDYDQDGRWYWNQAKSFAESSDDFDVTLAEMLLEEETFPVSFRSGWHAMDNGWQQRLDTLLPYSLHDDWPAKHDDVTEPIDNVYDWSRAPSACIPFHPSPFDYQSVGSCKGWNVRSTYMSGADSLFMDKVFAAAAAGKDQVVCLWAHLPETDFLENVTKVNRSAHLVSPRYPGIHFRYCTAVEAMNAWRKCADTSKPVVTLTEVRSGEDLRWQVAVNEPVFQSTPIVALKDRYEQYRLLACEQLGVGLWRTTEVVPPSVVAKVGAALTDTTGNCGISLLRYLPDDLFIDDTSPGYAEVSGLWSAGSTAAWGRTSRVATVGPGDTARVRWMPTTIPDGLYNIFLQSPEVSTPAKHVKIRLMAHGRPVDSLELLSGIPANTWQYVATRNLGDTTLFSLEMSVEGDASPGMHLSADVVKLSALVRDRWCVPPALVDVGEMIVGETGHRIASVRNQGIQPLSISAVASRRGLATVPGPFPVIIPPMGEGNLMIDIVPDQTGAFRDTLVFSSDDLLHPQVTSPLQGTGRDYFAVVDDRDSLTYSEAGVWSFSVAWAYGRTSRYAYPAPGVAATFVTTLKKPGAYRVESIVPTTVNASTRARYALNVGGSSLDSVFLDQNIGSGSWVALFTRELPMQTPVSIVVSDAMNPVVAGKVLRADAMRFQWIPQVTAADNLEMGMPDRLGLDQNYPNPFNQTTIISYRLPTDQAGSTVAIDVKLAVFDVLGRVVATLVVERQRSGVQKISFDAGRLATGVYYYRLLAGNSVITKQMVLIR